jgi:nucleoid-associated protein YejK
MKNLSISCFCVLMVTLNACSQNKSESTQTPPSVSEAQKAVEAATMQFIEGGDKSDFAALDAVLHTQYRVLMNRIFGDAVTVLDKITYLQMIKDKKIGGVPRQTQILSVSVTENIAAVELTSNSAQAELHSYLHFIKEPDGKWRLVSDMPFAKFKK